MPSDDCVQYHLLLPRSVADRLDALTQGGRVTKPAIIVEAVKDWLERKGDDALEFRFAHRLDRHSRQLERLERNSRITIESLGLFIRYMLAVTPPLAEDDAAGRALARDRFSTFVKRVGQQLADGRLSFEPEEDGGREKVGEQ